MSSIAELRAKIILNCELSFVNLENFIIAVSVMKRGDYSEHTAYVVAGSQRATVARASGSTAEEALRNLAHITSL